VIDLSEDLNDVLIIGAGPTGLTLACTLARLGIRYRIIDASAAPATGSRRQCLQPRSLEMLDDLGIAARIIANGEFGISRRFYDKNGATPTETIDVTSRPDAPWLVPLLIPQWRVEEALARCQGAFGQRIRRVAQLPPTVRTRSSSCVPTTISATPRTLPMRLQRSRGSSRSCHRQRPDGVAPLRCPLGDRRQRLSRAVCVWS
jgi:hypothetical protein